MPDVEEAWMAELAAAMRRPLMACARGESPANIAVMQLLIEARAPGEAEDALRALLGRLSEDAHALPAKRLRAALYVLRANPQAWGTVKTVLANVKHDGTPDSADEQMKRLATAFDRAARASPEGSVALYALGNPELLTAATAEIVERMREWGLLGAERRMLDLGCGIGRLAQALAADVKCIVGVDISGEMIEAARRRCAASSNVAFLQTSGRDLSLFGEGSFDLVLAADTFPYLVQCGMDLVEKHFDEAARVLQAGGDFLILNFSYRGDPEQDRADIRHLGRTFGFAAARTGVPAFSLWDGLAFHLVRD